MLLGLALDAWSGADVKLPVARVQLAERLGYDSVWTAEAYGADALTPLAYLAASTSRIKLASGVVQISARTPAATAMAFATLESLAGTGRVIAGLGLSGPQIVEGWYGQPWAKPIARSRDYVAIMRKIFEREGPVAHDGVAITLPYAGADATGLGKPLKSILHPNPRLPIYLAAGGPANVALAAEVADGWIPMGLSPANATEFRAALEKGAARSGRALDTLAIQASTTVHLTDDVTGTITAMKPRIALYVGGMGARDHNFHKDAMVRRGYPDAADKIQELFLAGRRDEATAAVPDEYVDEGALLGSPERVANRYRAWAGCGVTGLTIHAHQDEAIELMADLAELSNRGSTP
ncbi:MAG TPA: LLM class F420-dependent oxidoreductase [Acidimicrobiia bacterium]|nr:LLM class F420-dependent oxidoreductase [Acidimicrobiia bacterium]